MRRLQTLLVPALALVFAPAARATEFGATDFSVASATAGGEMMNETAGSVNSITNLLMGPGMYVIMAVGAVLALYGFGRGQKETLFTGIGLFIFAAIIRGIWTFLATA